MSATKRFPAKIKGDASLTVSTVFRPYAGMNR